MLQAALGLSRSFERVLSIEDMSFAGHSAPKPDARMFRVVLARLWLRSTDCVLVEDQLQHRRLLARWACRRFGCSAGCAASPTAGALRMLAGACTPECPEAVLGDTPHAPPQSASKMLADTKK